MPCGVRKRKQMRWAFNIYEQQARVRTRTHHDLREREEHERRAQRPARHPQHLYMIQLCDYFSKTHGE